MRRLLFPLMIMFALLAGGAVAPARAQPIIADLTSHLIAITTGFTGTEVVLFGATDGEGDIIVTVRGPEATVRVRRKEPVLGVWINRTAATFRQVPQYYALAATRPVEDILRGEARLRPLIGLDALQSQLTPSRTLPEQENLAFRAALVAGKQDAGLYPRVTAPITVLGNRLFRTTVAFPSNVPTGNYQVSVYLVRDGRIVGVQTTPLVVSQLGFAAEMVDFARRHAWLYGLAAVAMAVLAGWLGSFIFRRM